MNTLLSLEELFAGRQFERGIVILCLRGYLRFKLSLCAIYTCRQAGLPWSTRRKSTGPMPKRAITAGCFSVRLTPSSEAYRRHGERNRRQAPEPCLPDRNRNHC
jgi:hypothetical protein